MSDIAILIGPSGAAHIVEPGDVEELYGLPVFEAVPEIEIADPFESDEFSTQFDPHRQITLRRIFSERDYTPRERHTPAAVNNGYRVSSHPAHPDRRRK